MLDPDLTHVARRRVIALVIDAAMVTAASAAAYFSRSETFDILERIPREGADDLVVLSTTDQARVEAIDFLGLGRAQDQGESLQIFGRPSMIAGLVVGLAAVLLIHVLLPTLIRRSPGKLLTGLAVATEQGGKVPAKRHLLRTLVGVIDLFPFVLPGLVGYFKAKGSPLRQRLGDRAANTVVLDARKPVRIIDPRLTETTSAAVDAPAASATSDRVDLSLSDVSAPDVSAPDVSSPEVTAPNATVAAPDAARPTTDVFGAPAEAPRPTIAGFEVDPVTSADPDAVIAEGDRVFDPLERAEAARASVAGETPHIDDVDLHGVLIDPPAGDDAAALRSGDLTVGDATVDSSVAPTPAVLDETGPPAFPEASGPSEERGPIDRVPTSDLGPVSDAAADPFAGNMPAAERSDDAGLAEPMATTDVAADPFTGDAPAEPESITFDPAAETTAETTAETAAETAAEIAEDPAISADADSLGTALDPAAVWSTGTDRLPPPPSHRKTGAISDTSPLSDSTPSFAPADLFAPTTSTTDDTLAVASPGGDADSSDRTEAGEPATGGWDDPVATPAPVWTPGGAHPGEHAVDIEPTDVDPKELEPGVPVWSDRYDAWLFWDEKGERWLLHDTRANTWLPLG